MAGCFPRRETRQTFREMTEAMLMGIGRANCWTLAEALGHSGPHRLQHFLARALWDHDAVRDRLALWTAHQLGDEQAVLVVDETGDEKSSTDAVGAARQYSAAPAALADLVAAVCTRWRIEEDFRAAKSLTGLDQGQATCWNSWMRWSLISLAAAALLATTLARGRRRHQHRTAACHRRWNEIIAAATT